jgi:hypothetical protein
MAALNDEFDGGRGGHVRTGKVRSSDAGCSSDTVTADRLWEALHQARAGRTPQTLAHTQDAVFRFYLPMARTLARAAVGEPAHQVVAERAAELGLAHAVLAWRHRASGGFRRFARSAIERQLHSLFSARALATRCACTDA